MIVSALLISKRYKEKRTGKKEEYEEFLLLLDHFYKGLSSFLYTYKEMGETFKGKLLRELGFLNALSEFKDPKRAFLKTAPNFALEKEAADVITDVFSKLGTNDAECEKEFLKSGYERFLPFVERERKDAPRDIKIFCVGLVGAVLGIVIILI